MIMRKNNPSKMKTKLELKKLYPSDVSRDEFEKIREILESCRKKTKPRTVDLYEVFCGCLYVLKEGCRWRSLPKEYPKWRTVYDYFQKWQEPNFETQITPLEEVLKKIGFRRTNQPGTEIYNHLFDR